jgi:hypothetical protein
MDHTTRRLAPIPIDDRIMQLALQMKQAGLPWEPAVGCFVWDREGIIAQPSPFPKRIYFILSMKRFMAIFGDVEKMKHRLVWLPTWYQARQIIHRLQVGDMDRGSPQHTNPSSSPEAELAGLYQCILCTLRPLTNSPPAIVRWWRRHSEGMGPFGDGIGCGGCVPVSPDRFEIGLNPFMTRSVGPIWDGDASRRTKRRIGSRGKPLSRRI